MSTLEEQNDILRQISAEVARISARLDEVCDRLPESQKLTKVHNPVTLSQEPLYLRSPYQIEEYLETAAETHSPVKFIYNKPTEYHGIECVSPEERHITPISVTKSTSGAKLVEAFDHDRELPRFFRLDRIEKVIV